MTRVRHWLPLLLCAPLATACGDDGGGEDTDAGTSSGTDDPTTGTDPSSSGSSTDPGGSSTTSGADESSSSGDATAGSSSTGDAGDESSSGGMEFDCGAIPAGPFAPVEVFSGFNGSEDLAFDGQGGMAGKNGGDVIVVDAAGTEIASYADPGPAYGLRFTADGDLLVAHFQSGVISQIAPDGSSSDFATGIAGVNGLYPDFDGNVWATDFSRVVRFDSSGTPTTIVSGADGAGANGIIYDPDRGVAFFTNYLIGRLAKVEIGADGSPGAITELATVASARFDGLSLDICGNLYAVDNGNARIYRLALDADANAVGEATDIVDGNMQNIANAQFGRGEGFEETSLYAAGNPGVVYQLDVGVPGGPIPLP
ncbi:MAG: SMP-30/gluconolactonase/LRE family protein [Nannocystaceae bacterium]|nr:hypothetical protein [bacterium]